MGDQEYCPARRIGEAKKKLIAERDAAASQLQRWDALNRRLSHPCDCSEVGRQVIQLRERRDRLNAQVIEIDHIIHGEE